MNVDNIIKASSHFNRKLAWCAWCELCYSGQSLRLLTATTL